VRQLERQLGAVARKVARRIADRRRSARATMRDHARRGARAARPAEGASGARAHDEVGIATGMYYTPMGGDIMFVEASIGASSARARGRRERSSCVHRSRSFSPASSAT
jgi:ATP-dependent Lon protease